MDKELNLKEKRVLVAALEWLDTLARYQKSRLQRGIASRCDDMHQLHLWSVKECQDHCACAQAELELFLAATDLKGY